MMFAERDSSGAARTHRYANVAEVVRIRGPLDVGRLLRAAEHTAGDMDTLAGRFRHDGGADLFTLEQGRRRISHAFVTLTDTPEDLAASGLGETLRRAANQPRDLQDDPPVHVLVAQISPQDHLLLLVMDHSVSDGRTLVLFLRQLSRYYGWLCAAEGEESDRRPKPLPSFWDFTDGVAEARREREESREFWSRALYRAADVRGRPEFPGGRWKRKGTRDLTAVHLERWPESETGAIDQISAAHHVSPHMFILAAYSLVASSWSDGFVAVNYMRNGREDRRSVRVPGPLAEHAVTVPLESQQEARGLGIAGYLAAWAAHNAASPPYYGLTQRELETLESEENRLLLFNFLPAVPALRFGEAVGAHDPQIAALLEPYDTTSKFGVRMQLIHDPHQELQVGVYSDPEILPAPEVLGRAVRQVVRCAVEHPETPVATAIEMVRQSWS
ncbi:condensation domain-containing protein [Streptomyces sp. YGL11-2]|uniref:condensation domain-containing protein n=1 Tax=Streptomyces sp. YGL11-2 TaxID=3414028 RepID=UPI003CE8EBC7